MSAKMMNTRPHTRVTDPMEASANTTALSTCTACCQGVHLCWLPYTVEYVVTGASIRGPKQRAYLSHRLEPHQAVASGL
jgi:hypothetical protein